MTHQLDNLVRNVPFELRAAPAGGARQMVGHFAVFGQWTEIYSAYEGRFLERIAPTAFDAVIASGVMPKVLFDHGGDPHIGNKVLGTPVELEADSEGVRYTVDLFDTSYVRDLLPGLEAGEYGASFRFRVAEELWSEPAAPTAWNPLMLEERTITRIDPLYEFGPVCFPAYAGASAGVRSGTDSFFDRLLRDPLFVARMVDRLGPNVVAKLIAEGQDADDVPAALHPAPTTDGRGAPSGMHPTVLRARIEALRLAAK